MISQKARRERAELLAHIAAIQPATSKSIAWRVYGRADPISCIQMSKRLSALRKAGEIEFAAFEEQPAGKSGALPAMWRIKREDRTENALPRGN